MVSGVERDHCREAAPAGVVPALTIASEPAHLQM
jgi:hypothetical protein